MQWSPLLKQPPIRGRQKIAESDNFVVEKLDGCYHCVNALLQPIEDLQTKLDMHGYGEDKGRCPY